MFICGEVIPPYTNLQYLHQPWQTVSSMHQFNGENSVFGEEESWRRPHHMLEYSVTKVLNFYLVAALD